MEAERRYGQVHVGSGPARKLVPCGGRHLRWHMRVLFHVSSLGVCASCVDRETELCSEDWVFL